MNPIVTIVRSFISQPAGAYCVNRMLEWLTTLMMLGVALVASLTPIYSERAALLPFYELGFSTPGLVIMFLTVGLLRALALAANGNLPVYGPRLRSAGCVVGTVLWFEMALALVRSAPGIGFLPLSAPVYFFLAIGEFISCYRAATDVRITHQ